MNEAQRIGMSNLDTKYDRRVQATPWVRSYGIGWSLHPCIVYPGYINSYM